MGRYLGKHVSDNCRGDVFTHTDLVGDEHYICDDCGYSFFGTEEIEQSKIIRWGWDETGKVVIIADEKFKRIEGYFENREIFFRYCINKNLKPMKLTSNDMVVRLHW